MYQLALRRRLCRPSLAIILTGPFVAGLVGAIGFLISVYFALFETNKFNLDFSAARLIGIFAGMVLAIIFGGYVVISLPLIFVAGLAWLIVSIPRLIFMEMFS